MTQHVIFRRSQKRATATRSEPFLEAVSRVNKSQVDDPVSEPSFFPRVLEMSGFFSIVRIPI